MLTFVLLGVKYLTDETMRARRSFYGLWLMMAF